MSDDEIILNTNDCPICFNEITDINKYSTECEHDFCKSCLDKWFDRGKVSCPNCRKEIKYIYNINDKIRLLQPTEKIIRQVNINQPSGVVIEKNIYAILCLGNILCLVSGLLNIYLGTQCKF